VNIDKACLEKQIIDIFEDQRVKECNSEVLEDDIFEIP
jgi:hypothetical protein